MGITDEPKGYAEAMLNQVHATPAVPKTTSPTPTPGAVIHNLAGELANAATYVEQVRDTQRRIGMELKEAEARFSALAKEIGQAVGQIEYPDEATSAR